MINSSETKDVRPLPTAIDKIFPLLVGSAILTLGNGLQGTLIALRAASEGMPKESIGLMMAAFFFGYALGSVWTVQLVIEVGHIRTFAALASIASAVALIHILSISPELWIILRAIHGFCYAGLILAIESWLNASASPLNRGTILGFYGAVLMLSLAAAQFLLNVASTEGFKLFCIVSVLLSLALVPVTLSRQTSPQMTQVSRLNPVKLLKTSPVGVVGLVVAGISYGAFLGLGPTFAQLIGLADHEISIFMALALIGAFMFQFPLGWLSDRMDRRLVIMGISLISMLISLSLGQSLDLSIGLLGLAFLFGGMSFPTYPLCIAEVNDRFSAEEALPAASSLLLVYGIGAGVGPLIAGIIVSEAGAGGLFFFLAIVKAVYTIFTLAFVTFRAAAPASLKQTFVSLPYRMTHLAFRLRRLENIDQDKRSKEETV